MGCGRKGERENERVSETGERARRERDDVGVNWFEDILLHAWKQRQRKRQDVRIEERRCLKAKMMKHENHETQYCQDRLDQDYFSPTQGQ